jgi:Predicted Zn-dependent protease (DUF2268)
MNIRFETAKAFYSVRRLGCGRNGGKMKFYGRLALCLFLFGMSKAGSHEHVLVIDNRVDRFEVFYAHATSGPMDSNSRFSLWQKEDGLAAVPPGAAGDAMARHLVDAAWDKYPALIPRLPTLNAEAERTARNLFTRNNELLETGTDTIRARLVLYVGQFDDNAYTMPAMNNKPPTVLMPVESPILRLLLAHELTHAIHLQLADIKNSFGAPVGETMFMEGLAMHTAQRAVPGLPDAAYTEMPDDKEWFARCSAHRDVVLRGIYSDLEKSGTDIAMKYTFGRGNTGMSREAYCAAWFAVGKLLNSGKTLAELARVPEGKMVATIRAAMDLP